MTESHDTRVALNSIRTEVAGAITGRAAQDGAIAYGMNALNLAVGQVASDTVTNTVKSASSWRGMATAVGATLRELSANPLATAFRAVRGLAIDQAISLLLSGPGNGTDFDPAALANGLGVNYQNEINPTLLHGVAQACPTIVPAWEYMSSVRVYNIKCDGGTRFDIDHYRNETVRDNRPQQLYHHISAARFNGWEFTQGNSWGAAGSLFNAGHPDLLYAKARAMTPYVQQICDTYNRNLGIDNYTRGDEARAILAATEIRTGLFRSAAGGGATPPASPVTERR